MEVYGQFVWVALSSEREREGDREGMREGEREGGREGGGVRSVSSVRIKSFTAPLFCSYNHNYRYLHHLIVR